MMIFNMQALVMVGFTVLGSRNSILNCTEKYILITT